MPAKTHLDPEARQALLQLQKAGDNSFYPRIVNLYLETSEAFLREILQHASGSDMAKLKQVAHSWKSSSLGVGAKDLGALCAQLESMTDVGDDMKNMILTAIQEEYAQVKAELQISLKAS